MQYNRTEILSRSFFISVTTERKLCDNQPHSLHLPRVNCAAFSGINTRSADIGVTKNIRQPAEIALQRIERAGEQVTQIVGKHLVGINTSTFTEGLHISPDVASIQGSSRPSHEYRSSGDFPLF